MTLLPGTDTLDDSPLHELWTKDVGTPGYDKAKWRQLEGKLHRAMRAQLELVALVRELRKTLLHVTTCEASADDGAGECLRSLWALRKRVDRALEMYGNG